MGRNREDSEARDDMILMHEIDPSPVDESPVDVKKGDYFPQSTPSPPPPPHSSSLGLSGHNRVWWLSRIQRYSSYTFTAFLSLHITNTSLIPLLTKSIPAADTYLLLTRPYYQSSLLEPALIVLPLSLHIGSGLALRLYRRAQNVQRYGAESRDERRKVPWPQLSGTSALGYAMWPLLAGHVFMNRILPLWVEGGSSGVGLQYVAHGFAKHRAVAFTGYVALIGVGSLHIVWGWAKYMGWTPDSSPWEGDGAERALRKKRRWYVINALATVMAGLWMAGGLGVVGRGGAMGGWMGRGYDELYRRIPLFGKWI